MSVNRYRLYNFTDPDDLWKEINIYQDLNNLVPDIKYYKSFNRKDLLKEYKKVFLWFNKAVNRTITTSFINCFIKDENEILKIKESLIKGSDGRYYFKLIDKEGTQFEVSIDNEDYTSLAHNECKVYYSTVTIELLGYSLLNNKDKVVFSFTDKKDIKNFLCWVRDSVIKKDKVELFESNSGEVFTLTDSEIDEIVESVFKD